MKKKNYLIPEIAVFTDVSTMPLMAGSAGTPRTFERKGEDEVESWTDSTGTVYHLGHGAF